MRFSNGVFLALISFTVAAGPVSWPLASSGNQWPEACRKIVGQLRKSGNTGVRFSQRPYLSPASIRYRVLEHAGYRIPLPPVSVHHILIGRRQAGIEIMMLDKGKRHLFAISFMKDKPSDDVFAGAGPNGVVSSDAGKALTRLLFGGPVSLYEMTMSAYLYTPDDISCKPGDYPSSGAVAIGLILASVGPGRVVAAYRGLGRYPGYMTVERTKKRWIHRAWLPKADGRLVQFEWWQPLSVHRRWQGAFLLGDLRLGQQGTVASPTWLQALNTALRRDDRESWRAYLAAIRKAGMSPASLDAAREMMKKALPGMPKHGRAIPPGS